MEQTSGQRALPVWGRSLWQLNLDVAGAVFGVLTRRLVLGQRKVPSWSLAYELRVDFVRALITGTVTKQDVDLLRSGSTEDRQAVLEKFRKLQQLVNSAGQPMRQGCHLEPMIMQGLTAAWIIPPSSTPDRRTASASAADIQGTKRCRVILYFHGGAYIVCGVQTHRRLMSSIALASGLPLLGVEYRLMPQVGFSEILEDAVKAFKCLVDDHGFLPEEIALAGDSAGGHLAIALAAHICEGTPKEAPGAIYAMSPWIDPVDVACLQGTQNWNHNADFDYIGDAFDGAAELATLGFKGHKYSSLSTSDIVSIIPDLPPTLIQVGGHECLKDHSMNFVESCINLGADNVWLEIYDEQVHVFQMFDDATNAALDALSIAGNFILTAGGSHNTTRNDRILYISHQ